MTPLSETLGALAWTQLWQVTVVAVGVGLASRLFCRRRPHLAYVLWLVVLVKCLTPLVWSCPAGVFSWAASIPAATSAVVPTGDAAATQPSSPQIHASVGQEKSVADVALASAATSIPSDGPRSAKSSSHSDTPWARVSWAVLLGTVWLIGAAMYAGFALFSAIRCGRAISSSQLPVEESLATLAAHLARRLGIRRTVRLVVVREPIGPMACGWVRPMVVMPEALVASHSREEIEPLLAHELVHVRRCDAQWGLLQVVAQGLWWFHPLVWWINRQIVFERERCCDQEAVAGLACPPAFYARSLVGVLQMKRQWRWLASLPGARPFEITKRRLESLMLHSGPYPRRMPRWYWLILLAGVMVLVPGAGIHRPGVRSMAVAAEPASSDARPEAAPPKKPAVSAAALVQAVYDAEARVDTAKSFYIRTEYTATHTDEWLRWEAEHPRQNPFGKTERPSKTFSGVEEWAWDQSRIRHCTRYANDGPSRSGSQTNVWDGSLFAEYGEYDGKNRRNYVLGNKSSLHFQHSAEHSWSLPWGFSHSHRFWWLPIDVEQSRADQGLAPTDFELAGQEEIEGRQCHVVVSRVSHYRLYIGVDDGRLYRKTWCVVDSKAPGYDRLALLQKVGGPAIKTVYHWEPWAQSLEPDEQRRVCRELSIAEDPFARPVSRVTLHDYREVAPGCWLSFRQTSEGYQIHVAEPFLEQRSETIVTKATVNEPLADDLFHIELVDGVPVTTDWRYDPIIRYTYRNDQTEAERVALCEAEREKRAKAKQDMDQREAVIKARMGQAPPPLPPTGWLNSKPLTWDKLRGKLVVLHFWDVRCGPCENEIPFLDSWHDNSDGTIVVIGIHRPTDDLAAVRKKLEEFDAKYPVLIDGEAVQVDGIGFLHDWFGNSWWPHTVLINKRGQVAEHGRLWLGDIPEKMRRLAAEPD